MIKPEKMEKVSIVGPRDYLSVVAEVLYEANQMHLGSPTEEEYFKTGEPMKGASETSRSLVVLRSYLSHLKIDPDKVFPTKKYRSEEIEREVKEKMDHFQREIGEKIERQRKLSETLKALNEEIRNIEPLKALGVPPRLLKDYKNLKVFVGFYNDNPTEEIRKITADYEVIMREYRKELIGAVVVKKANEEEVFAAIQDFGFREISIPDIDDANARLKEIDREKASIKEESNRIEAEIAAIRNRELEFMLAMEEYLSSEAEKSELPLKSLVSKYTFFITGFIPKRSFGQVKSEIESKTQGKVIVDTIDGIEEEPPTLLKNPPGFKNFENLTSMFSVPKFYEVDPTMIMAIAFPIFFGMMLGDVGYGLLITLLALLLRSKLKTPGIQSLLNVAVYAGIVAIVFGVVYGEAFGPFIKMVEVHGHHEVEELPHFLWPVLHAIGVTGREFHPLFDRVEAVNVVKLLVFTLFLGAGLITFGFTIGFYNILKHHGLKDAILEKGTWIIGLIMLTMVITGFIYNQMNGIQPPIPIPIAEGWQSGVNQFYIVALPLAIIGFIMFVMAEVPKMGAVGLVLGVEILTWLGQIMSYARLLAIGLSSVYIAFVMNFIGIQMLGSKGGVFLIVGAIVLVVGHIINLILGIIDPGLQSLRLHYVEFFPKFLEGGGKPFKPFGRNKRFIEGTRR